MQEIKKKSSNTDYIAYIIACVIVILIFVYYDYSRNKSSDTISDRERVDKLLDSINTIKENRSNFEKGLEAYYKGEHYRAIPLLESVEISDSNYSSAQNFLKESRLEEKEQTKKAKQKAAEINKIKNKYIKLCKSGLYQYEIVERLQRDGFYMESSDFEKAPDGSTGIKQIYSKKINNDFTVYVSLQNAYSLTSYFSDVWIKQK
ncbi:MAG TPA: hypothetical protein DEP28_10160 [Bacteroidetes bacterium]|nr:hypothetical protein [Bacteroidota bacterium]HCN37069.1 hypothetical protein [Bacteroidota bacterium]HRE42213.1 hypothetical protein [Ignavibacteria bacterium]